MRFLINLGSLLVLSLGANLAGSVASTGYDSRAPFVVSLENEGGQFCSGSIVTNYWILTSASCVWNKQATEVSIGIQPLDSQTPGYHRRALKIHIHPDYVAQSAESNVALIKLKRPIEWNGQTVFMRLVNDTDDLQKMSGCLMAGWDKTHKAPDQLESVALHPKDQCATQSSHSLCVDENGERLCKFGEGSPLLCLLNERYIQAGYLSGKQRCGTGNASFTVSGVVHFHEWMMNVIQHKILVKGLQSEKGYLRRLSRFNWLIFAILFFVASVVILIKVLKSRFKLL